MKALIAMSGGVDSSVAAQLTLDAGYEGIGCTMILHHKEKIPENTEDNSSSMITDDAADARNVATRLHMPFYDFHFEDEFEKEVICRFIASYEKGLTPNPCIECNRHLKFDKLLVKAKELGCELLVTGHYARITQDETGLCHLYKAADPSKDQSYVLYSLTQAQLHHVRFPLGDLTKAQARAIALENGFVNANKPDSQDICFVPDGDYARVIEERTHRTYPAGNFVDVNGNVMGQHKGIIHYTIGQRRGLGLSVPESVYVLALRPQDNTVVLGRNEDLFATTAILTDFNWISGQIPSKPFTCDAKIRYRQPATKAMVTPLPNGQVRLEFEVAQRAITPGQAGVLYNQDEVLGGGIITKEGCAT